MKNRLQFPLIISVLILSTTILPAQTFYPANAFYTVAEDRQDFFFQPSEFSPLQTGVFNEVMGQLSNHPLSAINRNPANLDQITGNGYAYVDVKTLPEDNVQNYFGCQACFLNNLAYTYSPPPSSQTIQEPFLSAAFFMNPLENEKLRLGLTYQLMSIVEPFYKLTNYREWATIRPHSFDLQSGNVPAPSGDFFGEQSNFNKFGHFPSLYAGYEHTDRFSTGIKVSYNHYNGSGNQLTNNYALLIDPPNNQTNEFSRMRRADYNHWDVSGGVKIALNEQMKTGFSAGFLSGGFDQSGQEQYAQNTFNDQYEEDDHYYQMDSNFMEREGFIRDGKTVYAAAEYEWQPQEHRRFFFTYRGSRSAQDFSYGQASQYFRDSEGLMYYRKGERYWEGDEQRNIIAEGDGEFASWQHRFSATITQDFKFGFQLKSGVQVQMRRMQESGLELQQTLLNDLYKERIEREPLMERDNQSDTRGEITTDEWHDGFAGYLPVILSKSFGRHLTAEVGVLGSYSSIIRKYEQNFIFDRTYVRIEDGEESIGTSQNSFKQEDRKRDLYTRVNAFGSVSYSPTDQLNLRLMTYSDRRRLSPNRSVEAFRFQIAAEIGF